MGGIKIGRWLAGGVAAAVVIFALEGVSSIFYMDRMIASLEARGLGMEMSGAAMAIPVLVSLLSGLVLVFFYAAARPRFGPGPTTAVLVAVFFWAGGYLVSLTGYQMIGLYPSGLLVTWGAVGLGEMVVAALVGGWVYREETGPE